MVSTKEERRKGGRFKFLLYTLSSTFERSKGMYSYTKMYTLGYIIVRLKLQVISNKITNVFSYIGSQFLCPLY